MTRDEHERETAAPGSRPVTGDAMPSSAGDPDVSDGPADAEEALRAAEERLRALVDGSLSGILVHRARELLFANPALAEMLGHGAPGDLYPLPGIERLVAPHDRRRVTGYEEARLLGRPAPPSYEFDALCADGATVVVQCHARRARWEGHPAVIWELADVTERRGAELSLRESEELLRAIVECMPLDMNVKDAGGRYLMVNRAFLEKMQVTSEDVIGRTTVELFSAGDAEGILAHDRAVLAAGQAIVRELEVSYPDGSTRIESFTRFPIPGGLGRATRVGVVVQDVTESRRAERALRESEERFRNLVDGSIEGILVHRHGRPVFANAAFAEMLGYASSREVLDLDDLDGHWAAHERERLRGSRPGAPAGESRSNPFEVDAVRTDGRPLRLRLWTRGIDWFGEPASLVTVFDVSEEGRLRRALHDAVGAERGVVEALPGHFALFDAADRLVACTPAWRERPGVDPQRLVDGTTLEDFAAACAIAPADDGASAPGTGWLDQWRNRHRTGAQSVVSRAGAFSVEARRLRDGTTLLVAAFPGPPG